MMNIGATEFDKIEGENQGQWRRCGFGSPRWFVYASKSLVFLVANVAMLALCFFELREESNENAQIASSSGGATWRFVYATAALNLSLIGALSLNRRQISGSFEALPSPRIALPDGAIPMSFRVHNRGRKTRIDWSICDIEINRIWDLTAQREILERECHFTVINRKGTISDLDEGTIVDTPISVMFDSIPAQHCIVKGYIEISLDLLEHAKSSRHVRIYFSTRVQLPLDTPEN